MASAYEIRAAQLDDLAAWHAHLAATMGDNGADDRYFTPFTAEQSRTRFTEERLANAKARAVRTTGELDWLRVFLAVTAEGQVVGHADLQGGKIAAELHRATVGLGVERRHHRRGLGERLMTTAIAWARREGLAWMDLGVFSGNDPAIALYQKLGFVEVGRTPDRFRVGDASLTDVSMTLRLIDAP